MRSWFLPGSLVVLSLLSLLLIKSVAPGLAASQFIFFGLGFVVFAITARLPYSLIEQSRWLGYVALCLLLIVPLLLGATTRGIAGWIDIGTLFSIQPSQLAIPLVTLVIAHLLSHKPPQKISTLIQILGLILLPAFLIVIEPDLGTTVIYVLSMASLLFLSPVPMKYLLTLAGLGLVTAVLGWFFVLQPYQKERITSFIGTSSSETTSDADYNARQALIAVGSGQIMGRGLGQGIQSHLRFLPERQTDFIFASLAEELGFVGSTLVIALYFGISLFCLRQSTKAANPAQRYFCIVAAATMMFQSAVNMGMNMGMFPITGITLPFLSYGGSSIIATSLLLGVVQGLTYHSQSKPHLHLS